MSELFTVWWFDPQDNLYFELVTEDPKSAVEKAKSLTTRPAAMLGIIASVIVTDGGDCTCFEWINGKGVTFPPRKPDGSF